MKTIIMALITYIATSIDEIPVLFMLFTKTSNRGRGKTITVSYFIGTLLLVTISICASLGLIQIPYKWAVGLIGLLPLGMGIKLLFDGDDDEEKAMALAAKQKTLWTQVLVITLALGADDLGVYIPLFTTLNGWEILEMLFIFIIGTAVLCFISYRLTRIEKLTDFIEEKERFLVSLVFIILGIFVILECKTVTGIISLFS